jgi:hypothetical protein
VASGGRRSSCEHATAHYNLQTVLPFRMDNRQKRKIIVPQLYDVLVSTYSSPRSFGASLNMIFIEDVSVKRRKLLKKLTNLKISLLMLPIRVRTTPIRVLSLFPVPNLLNYFYASTRKSERYNSLPPGNTVHQPEPHRVHGH